MKVYTHKNHSQYLQYVEAVFENIAGVPDFKTNMETRGFTDGKIDEGQKHRSDAEGFYHEFIKKQRKRNGRKSKANKLLKEAQREYVTILQRLRREFFNDPETKAELGLEGKRETQGPKFIDESLTFYDTCIDETELNAKLVAKGVTTAMLEGAKGKITKYTKVRVAYEQLKGECQSLVEKRDLAFRQLRAWMGAFQYSAEYIYADNLQELERLNIFELNAPRKTTTNEEPAPEPIPEPEPQPVDDSVSPATGTTEIPISSPGSGTKTVEPTETVAQEETETGTETTESTVEKQPVTE
ncbi:MAG: hypothetical protein GY940_28510 [bacterium]|nr:hypothetical protein [bacterium]